MGCTYSFSDVRILHIRMIEYRTLYFHRVHVAEILFSAWSKKSGFKEIISRWIICSDQEYVHVNYTYSRTSIHCQTNWIFSEQKHLFLEWNRIHCIFVLQVPCFAVILFSAGTARNLDFKEKKKDLRNCIFLYESHKLCFFVLQIVAQSQLQWDFIGEGVSSQILYWQVHCHYWHLYFFVYCNRSTKLL